MKLGVNPGFILHWTMRSHIACFEAENIPSRSELFEYFSIQFGLFSTLGVLRADSSLPPC